MTLRFTPLGPALGAEVHGLDVHNINPETARLLREGWLRYQVLVVRGPVITEEELIDFGRCFGPLEMARRRSPLASREEIMVISNIRENGQTLGALPDGELSFHFDRIHQKIPNKAGVLHAIEIPDRGGETLFQTCAWPMKACPRKHGSGWTA